jgi:hypothetical protein
MTVSVKSVERREGTRPSTHARMLFVVVAALFVAVSIPVIIRGAPLADDFVNCLDPQRDGLGSTLAASVDRLGVLRKAHVVEIAVTTVVCQHLPFGFAIAVPLVLTLAVAVLLRGLLRDLGTPGPWPEVAGALWLLQPLGTEAALWPAALHVPLGLALALAALRLHRAGHHASGALAVALACLSVEQVILALPLAVWLTMPPDRRRPAVISTVGVVVALLLLVLAWPGDDPRLRATVSERIAGAVQDPGFFPRFVAVGLGLQSIPLAAIWAFPLSTAALASGAGLGYLIGPTVFGRGADGTVRATAGRILIVGVGLAAAVNVPIVFNVPHQGSPRLFAPTWLVVCAVVGVIGPLLHVRKPSLWGAIGGAFAAAALMSLALSVWVRIESAGFTESASTQIAAAITDDADVGLCDVTRTVVDPAPRGAFAVHEFIYDWAARDALIYYTGERADFTLAGELWQYPCPGTGDVDRVFSFPDLVETWRADG